MTTIPRQSRAARSPRPLGAGRALRAAMACALAGAVSMGLAAGLVGCAAGGGVAENGAGSADAATATRAFTAMDTGMTLTVHAADQAAADGAADACQQRVRELDALLAPAGEGSELARANAAGGAPVEVSASVGALVDEALVVARETNGAFDPTVYPLTDAWGFTDGNHRVPAPDEIAALLTRVDYGAVQVNAAAGTLALDGGAQVDVGGVAKGFAADELSMLLRERGVTSALFDLGGNVTALGSKPDGSLWKVGIADPSAPDRLAGALSVQDATVSTSGAYQRFFDEGGTRYHHLLDPATGYPVASDLASVSVVSPNGARCDALSTACYVLGTEGALALWRAAGGEDAFDLVLIGNDGSVRVTEGVAASFTAAEGYAGRVNVEERP